MSIPHAIGGREGEQFNTYTNLRHPLGTRMVLEDGRAYRFGLAGATALAAGKLMQAPVPGANFDELVVPAAVAAGSNTITVTNGATAITADQWKGGYVNVEDDTGEGTLYKIWSNPAAAGSASCVLTLHPDVGVKVALTTASTVGLILNPYSGLIVHDSVNTARLVGVPNVAVAAASYGWFQTNGPCSVLIDGTVIIGLSVMASNGVDGAVEAWGLTEAAPPTEITPIVGYVLEVAATTEYGAIFLNVE